MSGLPSLGRGRPTAARQALYEAEVQAFCASILEINSALDFKVSVRGWGYLLEGKGVITKGELDAAERLINNCRKSGALPLGICAIDEKRAAEGGEGYIARTSIDDEAAEIIAHAESVIESGHETYTPFSFWDDLPVYVEVAVEKIDLKSLFRPVVDDVRIEITNIGGWYDINGRAAMMERLAHLERRGKRCVLLYCGDHDPGGLQISDFIRSNMADLARAVGWAPKYLTIDRFGLDANFIDQHGLMWIDNLETSSGKSLADPGHPDHRKPYVQDYLRKFRPRKCEANALVINPLAGRNLCRQAILRYIPEGALMDYGAKLAAVRRELKAAVIQREGGAP
jgi:hypothetical protein